MANLIGFDKNRENVQFKGPGKLSVNFMSNYLYVEPKNEKFKLISASFKWNFIMKTNILFVFAEHDFLDFCLVFKNEQVCRKIFGYVASRKKDTTVTDPVSIDRSFINPIFQAISNYPFFNSDLINVMAKWYQLLDESDKEKYSNLMKDYGIFDLISAADLIFQTESDDDKNVNNEETSKDNVNMVNGNQQQKVEEEEILETFEYLLKPRFEIQRFFQNEIEIQILIIFHANDRTKCYHYFYESKSGKFFCSECSKTGQWVSATLNQNSEGVEYIILSNSKHVCEMISYVSISAKWTTKIGGKQNQTFDFIFFRLKNVPKTLKLAIYSPQNKELWFLFAYEKTSHEFRCIECRKMKKIYSIKLQKDANGKEYFNHNVKKHICEPIKASSIPKSRFLLEDGLNSNQKIKIDECKIVKKPNFQIRSNMFGVPDAKLIVFLSSDKSLCYKYYFEKSINKYRCAACKIKKLYVTAKLQKYESSKESFIELGMIEHVCKPQKYK